MSGTDRTAVITGLGVVAPTGLDTAAFWRSALAGVDGVGRITRFDPARYPVRRAGEVVGFDPRSSVEARVLVQTDLWTHFALAATQQALTEAALDPAAGSGFEIGVTTSASSGGNAFGQREIEALWARGPRFVGPYQSIAWFYAASTGQISINRGLRGPCAVVSSEAAGGLDALGHSRGVIRAGGRVQVTGGTEAPVSPYALTCQLKSDLLSTSDYRPFSRHARGYLPGEGGAVLVVEEAGHAAARGARPLARIAGHAATFAGPPGDGVGWTRGADAVAAAIRFALADADISATQVDAVFADGMGVPAADAAEVAGLRAALGPRAARVPVTAVKAGLGRAYSGAAALEATAAVLALRDGLVPPTPGLAAADVDHDIDLVTGGARAADLRHVLVLARGYGGFTSALVLAAAG
ncbi:beta-ketoacyl synthase N-terminal-like domain-containing protein [Actinokineospora sp. NBRC 105648]|uniref:beta-ketoacyl synthase N-terminal-like domain-containing protein n=1 Tax=Actinokineospora sp. NBRC 105648 TaxID=3032206 RepID=UPI0024A17BE9|nr:beta-ketoacyl synthase N-terminal-like domain-containing protein [Actinokineospora sp. NBRC 105648]GLZ42032.1 putative polyketide beta-ketoacyl synthase 2 [Actinokineospora sp. NBRC 105648]